MDKIEGNIKNDFKEHKNEIRKELDNNAIEIGGYIKSEITTANDLIYAIEKDVKQQNQKLCNMEKQISYLRTENTDIREINKTLLNLVKGFLFGNNCHKKNIKKNIMVENENYRDDAAHDSVNKLDLSKSFTSSMNLRRTNSCFFTNKYK